MPWAFVETIRAAHSPAAKTVMFCCGPTVVVVATVSVAGSPDGADAPTKPAYDDNKTPTANRALVIRRAIKLFVVTVIFFTLLIIPYLVPWVLFFCQHGYGFVC